MAKTIAIKKLALVAVLSVTVAAVTATPAHAMHISEGILPLPWAGLWYLLALPFIAKGIAVIKRSGKDIPAFAPLVGMVAAAVFIVSAMPIPIPTAGTCSHPAATGLAAIVIGPFATVAAASVALLIQALFLAHGGLSTWGANVLSMGVVGAFSGYFAFRVLQKLNAPLPLSAFLAGLLSDWATYTMTSFELALGLSGKEPFLGLFKAILVAFIPTQLPLGILEGVAAAGFFSFIIRRRPDIVAKLGIIRKERHTDEAIDEDEAYEEAVY